MAQIGVIYEPGTTYQIRGWREGEGDPRVHIDVSDGGNHDSSVLSLDGLAESLRDLVAGTPDIVDVEVRKVVVGVTDQVVPAP